LRRKRAGLAPLANSHKSWQPRVRLRAAGLAPSPQLFRSGSPSRKRRTKDGIAVSFSTVTPDCQELDWHDTRADTRPRDLPGVHPALQCLPTRTQAPSIAARRPAAQPRSAPLTGRDGQAGPARCPSCAWRPAPRPRPRSVCHVVVVGLGAAPPVGIRLIPQPMGLKSIRIGTTSGHWNLYHEGIEAFCTRTNVTPRQLAAGGVAAVTHVPRPLVLSFCSAAPPPRGRRGTAQ
jgi:hypothetical protein